MDVPLAEGKVLGERYLVERMLGAGGMSIVAVASDLAQGGQRVAIKMLLPHSAKNPSVVQRFQREQRTLQQLTNEHAVRLYGAGTEGEHPYMVLEYLVGSDLSEVLKNQGPVPMEDAIDYILQASEAIAEAHALGITHRDLKPGNLFLTRRPSGAASVKVLDFGISKATGPQRELGESTLTGTSAILGSPFYMSPEQLLCSRDVDNRTDVWSLGVTLYELLTNTLPFGAKSTQKVCKRILNDKPTPLREVRSDMPEELDHALLKSLQRKPAQRYETVTDMAIRLAPFGPPHAGESVTIISEFLQPTERRGSRVPAPPPSAPASAPGSAPAASFDILDPPTQDAQTLHVERRTRAAPRTKTVVITASAATLVLGLGAGIAIGRATADRTTTTDEATTARLSATSPPADESSAGSGESKDDDTEEPGERDEEPVAELPREVDLDLDAPPTQPPKRPPGGTPVAGWPRPPSPPSTTGAPQATAPKATSEPTAPTTTTTPVASAEPNAPPTQPKVDEVPDF